MKIGWGAIHFAVYDYKEPIGIYEIEKDKTNILRLIIEKLGVDPHFRTAKVKCHDDKWHSHHFLDMSGREYSIQYGALGNIASIKQHDSCYETALSLSMQRGNSAAIEYFLDHCKIDPNASCRGCDGATPLHVAAQNLQVRLVGILISKLKVNVNCIDRYKRTPLHVVVGAILSPRDNIQVGAEMIKMLVTAGAQLSATDIDGYTPRDIFEARKDINQEQDEVFKSMGLMELLTY